MENFLEINKRGGPNCQGGWKIFTKKHKNRGKIELNTGQLEKVEGLLKS